MAVPELQAWHRFVPQAELRATDIDASFTLAQYLEREATVFAQVHDNVEAPTVATAGAIVVGSRYDPSSMSSPRHADRDWNRTFEMVPADIRGGVLLVHGLTDSPYSMRTIAGLLKAKGYYALALRMPGHGTVPAGLVHAQGEDWLAAVRMGVRHVRRTIGPDRPLMLVGYSNGGAQVMRYALEATLDATLPAPSRIVLISPMIGVSPLARLARIISALGPFPGFEKARWLDVIPEYNPFKYNSFPANAGLQSFRVSSSLQDEIAAAVESGAIERLPPILTFVSVVDSTVSTPAVVEVLYNQLRGRGHELVAFDINRLSGLEPFIRPSDAAMVARLAAGGARTYGRTLITNVTAETLGVKARSVAPGSTNVEDVPLELAWPAAIFSLSHVALPFPPDDPIYGPGPGTGAPRSLTLGRLAPRGEKAVLTVPIETLMRVSWNPFFPYMAQRIEAWADEAVASAPVAGAVKP